MKTSEDFADVICGWSLIGLVGYLNDQTPYSGLVKELRRKKIVCLHSGCKVELTCDANELVAIIVKSCSSGLEDYKGYNRIRGLHI